MFIENSNQHGISRGSVEVITGSMFSGKTEELIRRLKRVRMAKLKTVVFTPVIDTRFSNGRVVSHDDRVVESTPVGHSSEIIQAAAGAQVVGIDEAQFFDMGLVKVCNTLANNGVRVIVAGLDMDFRGNPFGPLPDLLASSDFITKVHAICVRCGSLAQFSHRIADNENLVVLGSEDKYEPLCRMCFGSTSLKQ